MSTAQVQGRLWGARARDYADLAEASFRPLIEDVLDATGVGTGTRLLDVGCGTGLAVTIADLRGARVAGLDASALSIAIARERVPTADLRVGAMEDLPWLDDTFDIVTGFNAFQFAADTVGALLEARRVARPGGRVAMAVWGRRDDCSMAAVVAALESLLPPPPSGSDGPFGLATPGRLEGLFAEADLNVVSDGDVECAFSFPDLESALRGLLSAGVFVSAAEQVGDEPVRRVVGESLAQFRTDAGGYCLRNRLRYLIGSI